MSSIRNASTTISRRLVSSYKLVTRRIPWMVSHASLSIKASCYADPGIPPCSRGRLFPELIPSVAIGPTSCDTARSSRMKLRRTKSFEQPGGCSIITRTCKRTTMPVIRPTHQGRPLANLREPLVNAIARELTGESTYDGPVIFEMPTGRESEIDVIIVWDAWRAIPPAERSSIIHAAYQKHARNVTDAMISTDQDRIHHQPIVPELPKTAIGATKEESFSSGLLPFGVNPMARPDEVDPGVLRQLMIEAGGIVSPAGVQLRFPTSQLAADAHDFLMKQMPQGHWGIVETVDSVESWQGR